jgi:hypothetical protein
VISVLCPSRGNPQLLEQSAASLRAHAAGDTELLVIADDDDVPTVEMAAEVADVMLVVPRKGYAGLHGYYQELSALACGEWQMIWNDDATMLTPGWDGIISALPPDVLVADIQTRYSPLSCFPAVRTTAIEALGRFSTDNPHVDTFWQDVATALGVMRTVAVHAGLTSPVSTNSHGFYEPAHQQEMAACTQVLREYLKEKA